MRPSRSLRIVPLIAFALAGSFAATAVAAQSSSVRFGERPASRRIVIDMPPGANLTPTSADIEALDADPTDGRAVIRVSGVSFVMQRLDVSNYGTRVRVRSRPGGFVVLLSSLPRTPKFVSYATARSGTRLLITLWLKTTRPSAQILSDGCLRLSAWSVTPGTVRVRGRELQPLFEHGLVLSLRGTDAVGPSLIALKPITAKEGTFRPDFSGYSVPGRWSGSLSYPITIDGPRLRQRAMLEAWSSSAKDGSLDCLVQVPVIIG